MVCRWGVLLVMVIAVLDLLVFGGLCEELDKNAVIVKTNPMSCTNKPECTKAYSGCCTGVISTYFTVDMFEKLFPKRNAPTSFAQFFYDYQSFITASYQYQPLGFGTTGKLTVRMMEIAAFLGLLAYQTSTGSITSTGGKYVYGLSYKEDLNDRGFHCDNNFNVQYPCSLGAEYFARGPLRIIGNELYGYIGDHLGLNLLQNPDLVSTNATVAFSSAMFMWMQHKYDLHRHRIPSPHEAFLGLWRPSKNQTKFNIVPGLGAAMNVLLGSETCGKGDDNERMVESINHYLYFLDLMGVGREFGEGSNNTCAHQGLFSGSYFT